eukprot:UN27423
MIQVYENVLMKLKRESKDDGMNIKYVLPHQEIVRYSYENMWTQTFVAVLIFCNFVVEAVQSQVLPDDRTENAHIFMVFEYIFTLSFTVELLWNMYGNWFVYFWFSGWNVFDFVIVLVSVLAMSDPNLPGITVLRLFRAFRVFRLFRRIESLKRIV